MENIPEVIRKLRLEKKIQVQEMAEKIGFKTSAGYIKIEKGETELTLNILNKIVQVLGMSITEIINYPNKVNHGASQNEMLILDYVKRGCYVGANLLTVLLKNLKEVDKKLYEELNEKYKDYLKSVYEKELRLVVQGDDATKEGLQKMYLETTLESAILEAILLLSDSEKEIANLVEYMKKR